MVQGRSPFPYLARNTQLHTLAFPSLSLHFHCFCASNFLHICYSPFALSQSAVLMLSQVFQKEIARLQVPQKRTEHAFFLAFPSAWNTLPSFPPWYIKYLPFLWENWESICSASCSICNNSKSSDVLPIFQQRAPLNPFPWVTNTAHVPRVGMLADRRRVELVGSVHLVFPFPQNAFPYPRKEAARFGKYISVTCLLPEVLILGSWEEKK